MVHSEGCSICGKELIHGREHRSEQCFFCGATAISSVVCPDGHFVCDECHRSPANTFIEKFCSASTDVDPMKMAVSLMRNRVIKMHGPEHHFLVPAVLIACYYNHLGEDDKKRASLVMARKRAELVPGGYCGTHGACGAALGAGIFASVISGATPLSEKEWSFSNRITGKSLMAIASKGGPRCCKRDSFIVIGIALEFLQEEFNVELPKSEVHCEFFERNRQCLFENCSFYP